MNFKISKCLKVLLFLSFFNSISLDAQQANTDFANQMNTVFQNLDKNRVPHGILTDFGLDYVDLLSYDGSLSTDNYTSRATVHESFYDLISSRIRQVNTGFMQPQAFEKLWHNHRTEGIITLGGLYFKYAKFKDNARTSGKVNVVNNKLYDVFTNGTWQNPYEEKSTFILAPSINHYKGLNFQVKLPQDIFLSNYPAQVQSIAVDFGDGLGYRTIGYNQSLNVTYATANTYVWKYKLTLTNAQILYSHSEVVIEEGLKTRPYGQVGAKNSALDAYQKVSVTATEAYYSKFGEATLYIRDAGSAGITKPLIVAEGFDTGAILNPEQEAGDNNIIGFLNGVNSSLSNLPAEINTYDIIYVDWDNGVDFIQRNAFALEEAIRWVNQQKQIAGSTIPNTIIGQSMGGLVARYALANIEDNGDFNHDTDLYISHDAPHLGANTPIALQHFNRHIKRVYQSAPIAFLFAEVILPLAYDAAAVFSDTLNNQFGTNLGVGQYVSPAEYLGVADFPASRQMLYNWVAPNYSIFNGIHDAWQQDLSDLGYPQGYTSAPIRNIAIANGSECGITQALEGDLISISKDAADKTVLNAVIGLTDLGVAVGLVLGGNFFDAVWLAALAVIPGSSSYDIDFHMRPMLNLNQNKEIYYGRIRYKKKILWFIPVNVNFTNVTKDQPNGILPYDTYGGGWFNPGSVIDDLPSVIRNFLEPIDTQRYGFIPTASALDVGKGIVNLNDMDYKRDYVGGNAPPAPKDSPFDNFTTHFDPLNPQNNNSAHISFNTRNGNWLTDELTGTSIPSTDCSFVCENSEISGLEMLCSTQNYSLSSIPITETVNWSATPSNLVTISSSGSSATVTPNTNASGEITLRAFINSTNCGAFTRTKTIWVGKPRAFTTNPDPTICTNVFNQPTPYSLPISPSADSYQLTSNSPNLYVDAFAMPGVPINMMTALPGNYTITLTTSNSCGTKQATIYVTAENCDGGGFGNFRVMQNPVASASLMIVETEEGQSSINTINDSIDDKNNHEEGSGKSSLDTAEVTLQLYDFNGNLLRTKKFNRDETVNTYPLNVSELNNAKYFIRITYATIEEVYQVIIDN